MTFHSMERAKQRANLGRSAATRMIESAMKSGKGAETFPAKERKYLESKSNSTAKAVVFDGYIFIIGTNGNCITMYKAPYWFGKKKTHDGKERIRNAKYYLKMIPQEDFGTAFLEYAI